MRGLPGALHYIMRTYRVDQSSSVSVEQIKGLFNLSDFVTGNSGSVEVLGLEGGTGES